MQNSKATNRAKINLILVCMLFGTIGVITRIVDLPSTVICFGRAVFAVLTILVISLLTKRKMDFAAIKRNFPLLLASGLFMCFNWFCQFEAFRYTTIATATLCYYMQPIFFILGARIFFKEKLSAKKMICVVVAFCGMIMVSGVVQVGFNLHELRGAIIAAIGAVFYAAVVLLNKGLKDIDPNDSTMVMLTITSVIMFFYIMFTEDVSALTVTPIGISALILMGVLHTGIGYVVYFKSMRKLSAQTVGVISYMDPVEAVLLSALVLREPLNVATIAGAILILGATAVSELSFKFKNSRLQ